MYIGGSLPVFKGAPQEITFGPAILDNFCPASNFPFLDRVVEKLVGLQILKAMRERIYLDHIQSELIPDYSARI